MLFDAQTDTWMILCCECFLKIVFGLLEVLLLYTHWISPRKLLQLPESWMNASIPFSRVICDWNRYVRLQRRSTYGSPSLRAPEMRILWNTFNLCERFYKRHERRSIKVKKNEFFVTVKYANTSENMCRSSDICQILIYSFTMSAKKEPLLPWICHPLCVICHFETETANIGKRTI